MSDNGYAVAATRSGSDRTTPLRRPANALTIVNVAHSLAPVTPNPSGGAEQVLLHVDKAIRRAGHTSIVVANEHPNNAARTLGRSVDLVHYHGIDFNQYDVDTSVPRIVTLHRPPDSYPAEIYDRKDLFLVCVSESERAAAPRCDAVVPNGVDLASFYPDPAPALDYCLALGRICREKNFHIAMSAAKRAGVPLVLAGAVSRDPEHERYFNEVIRPLLDEERTYAGPVNMPEKRELIADARCLIVPSIVAETSSIVAMEALACGVPVIAMRAGALPEIVDDGVTGFIVDNEEQMVQAIERIDEIDRATCRRVAEKRFDSHLMAARYIDLYERIAKTKLLHV